MSIFFDAPVEPDALTTFVREVPLNRPGQTRRLLGLFGTRTVDDNRVDTAAITRTNRVARFRSWDGRLHVSTRDTGSERTVSLPPLSSSLSMGEYERLQLQFARTGGTNEAALARAIYDDATQLTNEVLNRLELAWGDLLTDGKFTMMGSEGGLEADYGVPSDQFITVGTPWTTTATAPALSDLLSAYDLYTSRFGEAGSLLTSRRVQRLLCQNTEIINAVAGAQTGRTRVNLAELNDLFAQEGLPQLDAPFDESLDVDGTTTRVLADDKLVFLPTNPDTLGEVVMGVTATALELVNANESELSFEDAPGIVGVVEKVGPPYRQFTWVDACGMPTLYGDKPALMTMDVA
jgi:hypothetical protein